VKPQDDDRRSDRDGPRNSEQGYRELFESQAQGVVYLSRDGEVTAANPAAERALGMTIDQMRGRTPADPRWRAIHEDGTDFPGDEHFGPVALRTGRPAHGVMGVYNPVDESYRWLEIDAVPLIVPGETEPTEVFATFDDITARKQMEEELRQSRHLYETFIDATDDIAFLKDEKSRYLFVNTATVAFFGRPRDEIIGLTDDDLMPAEAARGCRESDHRALAGREVVVTTETVGDRIYEARKFSVELAEGRMGVGGYIRDVSELRQVEEAAERARRLLDDAQAISQLGGWEYDVATEAISWTEEVYRIHGVGHDYDPNDLNADLGFYAPDSLRLVDGAFRRARDEGEPYELELELNRADGRRIWVRTAGRPVLIGGDVVRVTGNIMDITDRKQIELALRESERLLMQSQRVATLGHYVLDAHSGMWSSSETLDRVFGIDARFTRNVESWLEIVHPDDRGEMLTYLQEHVLRDHNPFDRQYRIVRVDDGRERWVHGLGELESDDEGDVVKMFGIIQDVTERKLAEDEVHRLNTELEQRVRERTDELAATLNELESYSYSISHDLRTPLRALDGFSQLLLDKCGGTLDDEGREYLHRIRAADQRMASLIDGLLEVAHLSRAEIRRRPTDLSAIARAIGDELRDGDPQRAVELNVQDGLRADADPDLARVLLANLIGNAWKFTSRHDRATIEVGAVASDGADDPGEPVFFVRDDGAGFDMAYGHKLFRPFQRLHAADEFEGTGIGLATVQRVVHRHGGRVWAESMVEKGTTVFFTLPEVEDVPQGGTP
jgi:PAS domain S-box-containing protein